MSMRRTKTRGATAAAALAGVLVLALSGCGGGDDDPEPEKSSAAASSGQQSGGGGDDSDADSPLAQVRGGDLTLTLTSAVRDSGGFVTVNGSVTNNGGQNWAGLEWVSEETELAQKNRASMAGAKLIDKKGKKRYYILRDTEGRCLCTSFTPGGVPAGETKDWYAQFPAPPGGNDEVDFQIADMPPATITISEG
jgi:hypothetical protein